MLPIPTSMTPRRLDCREVENLTFEISPCTSVHHLASGTQMKQARSTVSSPVVGLKLGTLQ